MKKTKKIIKILTMLIIIILIVSFTGYNLYTEPKNIKVSGSSRVPAIMNSDRYVMDKFCYNITQYGSKSEFLTVAHIPNTEYCPGNQLFLTLQTYKIKQKLNFPMTNISVVINHINVQINSNETSYVVSAYFNNYSIQQAIGLSLPRYGNNRINLSFSIMPIYEINFLHYNDKAKKVDFRFNLTGIRITSKE